MIRHDPQDQPSSLHPRHAFCGSQPRTTQGESPLDAVVRRFGNEHLLGGVSTVRGVGGDFFLGGSWGFLSKKKHRLI